MSAETSIFDLDLAVGRWGRPYVGARLRMQAEHAARVFSQTNRRFLVENAEPVHTLVRWGFRLLGCYRRAHRNFMDVRIVHNRVPLRGLPPSFDGFTICQLTDLHIDLDPVLTGVIRDRLAECRYDLCVLTGDYRDQTHGPHDEVMTQMAALRPAIQSPVYAILGNHDFLEMVAPLEALGYPMLVNECAAVEAGDSAIHLAGIDDVNTYMLDNLDRATQAVPNDGLTILLSHSPNVYKKAAAYDVSLVLAGHTHAGQICLPGGVVVMKVDPCPRRMLHGGWTYRGVQGYTSAGTGSCAVPLRWFSRPEIVLHELVAEAP